MSRKLQRSRKTFLFKNFKFLFFLFSTFGKNVKVFYEIKIKKIITSAKKVLIEIIFVITIFVNGIGILDFSSKYFQKFSNPAAIPAETIAFIDSNTPVQSGSSGVSIPNPVQSIGIGGTEEIPGLESAAPPIDRWISTPPPPHSRQRGTPRLRNSSSSVRGPEGLPNTSGVPSSAPLVRFETVSSFNVVTSLNDILARFFPSQTVIFPEKPGTSQEIRARRDKAKQKVPPRDFISNTNITADGKAYIRNRLIGPCYPKPFNESKVLFSAMNFFDYFKRYFPAAAEQFYNELLISCTELERAFLIAKGTVTDEFLFRKYYGDENLDLAIKCGFCKISSDGALLYHPTGPLFGISIFLRAALLHPFYSYQWNYFTSNFQAQIRYFCETVELPSIIALKEESFPNQLQIATAVFNKLRENLVLNAVLTNILEKANPRIIVSYNALSTVIKIFNNVVGNSLDAHQQQLADHIAQEITTLDTKFMGRFVGQEDYKMQEQADIDAFNNVSEELNAAILVNTYLEPLIVRNDLRVRPNPGTTDRQYFQECQNNLAHQANKLLRRNEQIPNSLEALKERIAVEKAAEEQYWGLGVGINYSSWKVQGLERIAAQWQAIRDFMEQCEDPTVANINANNDRLIDAYPSPDT
uniref:Uncharacterized protein n=1 Tax=Cyanophora sudae TaxID=1522369 RepID=A0A2Z4HFR1_9EUKA|nr:hypothetical protein [Cyanophora sudae]AWW13600.1 hypothetical protein [Cyanophora sudae]